MQDEGWAIEEAVHNAWPASRQLLLGGFVLRAAGGPTRRTNSVNPLRHGPGDPGAMLAAAEGIYARLGQACLFRVPSLVPGMDAPLERAGYTEEGGTLTLAADRLASIGAGTVELADHPNAEWLAARDRVDGGSEAARLAFRTTTNALLLPRAFAVRRVDGAVASLAYGAVHGGWLVVESVATHPEHRGRGLAREVVGALMGWAAGQGARGACLQVVADNAPALAVYRALGFGREVYRYHYRRQAV